MRDLIWLIVIILLIGWLVGFFAFTEVVGNLIHILLVLAVIAILYRLATGRGGS
ncbi:MAG TPA: lmo0937 family membrane protein [Salinimicrobium sp.]|nr:lmo0937 family membrane protein [Salinimicrobium sp.]